MLVRCKACREHVEASAAVPCPGRDGNYCAHCFTLFELDEELETIEESPQLVARVERLRKRIRQHHMDHGITRGGKHTSEPAVGAVQEVRVYGVRRNGITYLGEL